MYFSIFLIIEFIIFNLENLINILSIRKYNHFFEEYRRVQLNSLSRRGACTRRNARRCRTCFTLYDQSRVAAKGPTRFDEHLRLFPPMEENDRSTKYNFPSSHSPPSHYFLPPRATRCPKAIILPRFAAELNALGSLSDIRFIDTNKGHGRP